MCLLSAARSVTRVRSVVRECVCGEINNQTACIFQHLINSPASKIANLNVAADVLVVAGRHKLMNVCETLVLLMLDVVPDDFSS